METPHELTDELSAAQKHLTERLNDVMGVDALKNHLEQGKKDTLRELTAQVKVPALMQERLTILGLALSQGKMTKLAYAIQKASLMPVRHIITAGEETFIVYIYPLNLADFQEVQAVISAADKTDDAVMRICMVKAIRDEDGNKVWERPEDIEPFAALEWARLRLAIYKTCLGIDLGALVAEKKG